MSLLPYAGWEHQQYISDSIAWETNPAYGWCEKNRKPDGSKYNIYSDGLKIYTGIDSRMQAYAEEAVRQHVAEYLQPRFSREKKGRSYAPFSQDIPADQRQTILERDMRNSERYRVMKRAGASKEEIVAAFNTPIETELFTYNGFVDTIISPMDSINIPKHFYATALWQLIPTPAK